MTVNKILQILSTKQHQLPYNNYKLKSYIKSIQRVDKVNSYINNNVTRSWFWANELRSIYKVATPNLTTNKVISVVSFGGGLYGTVDPTTGILTNGDVQSYWTSIGISSNNMPKVVVKTIDGATNSPNSDFGATVENTIDIQTIGAFCPSSKLTIVLYISPNSLSQFVNILTAILNSPTYKPNVISISWGLAEIYYSSSLLTSINNLLLSAVNSGINVCAATGDYGSNDGVGGSGNYADFPASSPNIVACGGTKLICPNLTYDSSTTETAWSSGGGAVSAYFSKPTYQSALSTLKRSIPDMALDADPNTAVIYLINGSYYIIGGTSIVSPAMSGYLASISTNKFANTILYNNKTSFNDIVSGSNGGYNATIGYDNCTGLGSIKGDLLTIAFNTAANILVSKIVISNRSPVSLKVNTTIQLTTVISPANATNKSVTWTSSKPTTVSVSSTGVIRGVNIGTATITVRTVDQNKTATIIVNVKR